MKKTRRFLLFGISALLGLCFTSCQKDNMNGSQISYDGNGNGVHYNPEMIDMDANNAGGKNLSSIKVDGKTDTAFIYELGDKFDETRYTVTANYVSYDETGAHSYKEQLSKGYYFDYSNVDFVATGVYPVTAYYRVKTKIVSSEFKVTIRSNALVESGKEYMAGLQIVTNDYKEHKESNPNAITVLRDTPYVRPTFTATGHVYIGATETRTRTINPSKLIVDDSQVDTSKEGVYYIKVSYDNTANCEMDNVVVAFIIYQVINPIQSIEFKSGVQEFSATAFQLDTSSWKMYLQKQVGEKEEVNFDDMDFTLSGVNTIVAGEYEGKISLPKNVKKTEFFECSINITITASTTSTIISYLSFGEFMPADYNENDTTNDSVLVADLVKLGDNGRVCLAKNANDVGVIYANFAGSGGIDEHRPSKEATGFDIDVTCRYKLGGAGSVSQKNIEVVLPSKGVVVVYFASASSGTERTLQMLDDKGQRIDEAYYVTGTYAKATFVVEEAGTYYFVSQSSGINIYAVVASYENE